MQKTKSKAWMGWVLAVAVLGGGGWWWKNHRAGNGNGGTSYKMVALERGEIVQSVTANGALGAVQTVAVGSEVSGKIVELFADYNSSVTNGQVLARLDASTYERQMDQAQAELLSSKASLKLAQANFKRAEELRALDLVSQSDYDQAEATLAQAQASLQVREANLSKVQVDLEKTTIFSPMDGVVISRAVDVGQTVAASLNAPTLFTLAQDLRKMRIEAQISEADVGDVGEGQTVKFTVDAYPSRSFTGVVSQVRFEPVTNQGVVNYVAIVDVENGDLKLRPGMTANATVVTACRENVLRLPNSALRFRPPEGAAVAEPEASNGKREHSGGAAREHGDWKERPSHKEMGFSDASHKMIYVVDEKGELMMQPVRLGISDGTWTEILSERPTEGTLIVTGIQVGGDKEKAANSASSSPFMPPHPPGPHPGR